METAGQRISDPLFHRPGAPVVAICSISFLWWPICGGLRYGAPDGCAQEPPPSYTGTSWVEIRKHLLVTRPNIAGSWAGGGGGQDHQNTGLYLVEEPSGY